MKRYEPALDIYETVEGYVVLAELPGVVKDALAVSVEKDVLSIAGAIDTEHNFYKELALGDSIDRERIDARLVDGVLRLELFKTPQERSRRIVVN